MYKLLGKGGWGGGGCLVFEELEGCVHGGNGMRLIVCRVAFMGGFDIPD